MLDPTDSEMAHWQALASIFVYPSGSIMLQSAVDMRCSLGARRSFLLDGWFPEGDVTDAIGGASPKVWEMHKHKSPFPTIQDREI